MRKIYLSIITLISFISFLNAQTTQLNENFTAPFNITSAGWVNLNNSSPIGPLTWAQGIGTVFPAYNGGVTDYLFANFNSQGTTSGGISNFLITPTLSLMNGGVIQFVTRTVANPAFRPDRLQLLMSYGTGTGSIPSGTSSVGTFTVTLQDINPTLTTTGYPGVWTVYTTTLSGITGTVTGRFAFRYFVSNGGLNGTRANYIGLDAVTYTTSAPCPPAPVVISPANPTICAGDNVTLAGSGATSYTWSSGPNSSSINVSPSSTTVYTLTGTNPTGCPGIATVAVVIDQPPVVTVNSPSVCLGAPVTLIANGANTYSWSNGATTSSIVVSVGSTTNYTVIGYSGSNCFDTKVATVTTNNFLIVAGTSLSVCPGQPFVLGAGGALTYTWSNAATTASIVVTPTANSSYTVTGNNGSCSESKVISLILSPNIFAPSFTTCAGTAATLIATGATSYSWSNGGVLSSIVVTPSVNSTYTVTGTTGGCSVTKTVSVTLGNKLSVLASQECIGGSLFLNAYGASSYTWYPINSNSPVVIVTPTAATIYTLVGKSGTCSGTQTLLISFCAGVESYSLINESINVYPNPFSTQLKISGANGELKLVNLMGQVIFSRTVEETTEIDTESLKSGIYFVIVTNPITIKRKIIRVIKN